MQRQRQHETRRGGTATATIPAVIAVEGEEATIEAGYLAAKLGLSVDRLRAEMPRGVAYGVAERDIGEDAGRLRLTFRHHAHVDRGGRGGRHSERGTVARVGAGTFLTRRDLS